MTAVGGSGKNVNQDVQTMVETMQGQHERKDTDKMLGMLLHLLELYSLYSLIAVNS